MPASERQRATARQSGLAAMFSASFSHLALRMSVVTSPPRPARWNSSAAASARGEASPVGSPMIQRFAGGVGDDARLGHGIGGMTTPRDTLSGPRSRQSSPSGSRSGSSEPPSSSMPWFHHQGTPLVKNTAAAPAPAGRGSARRWRAVNAPSASPPRGPAWAGSRDRPSPHGACRRAYRRPCAA